MTHLPKFMTRAKTGLTAAAVLAVLLAGAGCGYHVSGETSRVLPPSIRTIAVPPFENQTLTFRIEQNVQEALIHEFLSRTRYLAQSATEGSDATLTGAIVSMYSSPVLFDSSTGRTSEVLLNVTIRVKLVSNSDGKTLFQANDWTYRESYQISQDPGTYFGEDQPARERLSKNIAASLVSAVMEGFP
jgi:outer membrane lipopolysaccharide assembly protein LptE/RlpB